LQLLRAQEDCKHIDALGDEYEKKFGRRPKKMADMVQAGMLQGVPVDAAGFAYTLSDEGKAQLNLDSPLLEKQVMVTPQK
jgi:hypothetical protein